MRCSALSRSAFVCAMAMGCANAAPESSHPARMAGAPIEFPVAWPFAHPDQTVAAPHGMVSTDAPLATHVGADVLRHGGNAVDAAIATAFALAVVFPGAGNIGGGGFMVVHLADGREAALDFRETAPGASTRDMYLRANGHADDRSITGDLSAGVPGSVAGLWAAHERFGTRPWAELVAPAIALAEQGFVVDSEFAGQIHSDSVRLSHFAASKALFLPGGRVPSAGDRWQNPDLAMVLRGIAASGPAGFYAGPTAQRIAAEMRRGSGIITAQDLASYKVRWRDPIAFDYRGHRVLSMPPPSSGGITMALAAHELSHFDLHAAGWHSPRELSLFAESMRRGFAVRNALMGDPDFVSIPTAELLSQRYADSLASTIVLDHATPSSSIHIGGPGSVEGHQTTHFSVVDSHGGAAAITTTINGLFGSAVVVPGAGFLMNDEMDDFAVEVGKPNMFGLVQGENNSIAPGRRMLSSMTPTIVLDTNGSVLLVTGASGGPTIISSAFQVMSNVLDYGMDIGTAVRAPRVHHQHLPDTLFYERTGLTTQTLDALKAMGYATGPMTPGDDGIGIGASILRRKGVVYGAHDPRVRGASEGY